MAGLPLLYYLSFDFNPINLRSPAVESVATYLDLRSDPNLGANAINVVLPKSGDVDKVADRLRKMPEVARVMTVQDFVPQDQDRKLTMIRGLARQLRPALQTEDDGASADRCAERRGAEEHGRYAHPTGRSGDRPRRRRSHPFGREPVEACAGRQGQA